MRITRRLAARALCSTALVTGVIGPAFAQDDEPAPEEYRNVDEHGVDMVTGTFNFAIPEGRIGPAEGGVSMVRYYGQSGYRDNWSGDLREVNEGGQHFIVITFGGISERFKKVGSSWVAEKADGATLVETGYTNPYMPHYIYTRGDGTVIRYANPKIQSGGQVTDTIVMLGNGCQSSNALACGVPTSIYHPNGVGYTLTWRMPRQCSSGGPGDPGPGDPYPDDPPPVDPGGGLGDPGSGDECTVAYRLFDVRSNAGYAIKIKYASNSDTTGGQPPLDWWRRTELKFMDLSQVSCADLAPDCDGVPGDWPTVTYSSSGSYPGPTVLNINNSQQGTWKISRNFTTGETRLRRPGATADTTIVTRNTTTWKVTSVTEDGATKTYNWGTSGGNPSVTSTDGTGATDTVVTSPATPQPGSVATGATQPVTYTYDSNERLQRITYPEGNYVHFTRDARGNVTQVLRKAKPGSGGSDIVTTGNFDASCTQPLKCNKPNYTIDARGNRTDYTYHATHGLLTRVRLPAPAGGSPRPEINYSYTDLHAQVRNGSGVLVDVGLPQHKLTRISVCATAATCAGSANETVVTLAYDTPNLLLTSVTTAAGNGSVSSSVGYSYDARDNLIGVDGPLAGGADTVTYIYDGKDRRIGEIGPDPDGAGSQKRAARRYTFDSGNRVTKVEAGTVTAATAAALGNIAALQTVDIAYDADGNAIRRTVSGTSGAVRVTQFSYDADNRLTCTALRMNPAAWGSLPSSACTMGPAGTGANAFGPDRITKSHYDGAGRVWKVQTAVGTADAADEVTTHYTVNGLTAYVTDGEANRTTYEYDGHDRLRKTRYPVAAQGANASSTTDYEQLTYDAASNVTQRRLRDGQTIAFGYDALGRPTSMTGATVVDRTISYDLLGRPLAVTYVTGGQSVVNTWDALGRLTSQTAPQGTVGYQYDAASRRTRLTWPDGFYVTYDYHTDGSIKTIRQNGSTALASYAYDAQGRPTGVTFANGTSQALAFDPAGRLSSLAANLAGSSADNTRTFSYNPAGQIAQAVQSNDAYAFDGLYDVDRAYTANGRNQYTAVGADTPGYDTRGNLTSSGGVSYAYDGLNQLTSLSGAISASLAYDPVGRLYQMATGGASTRFAYDGVAMIGEYSTSGALLRRYVHGPGIDSPIVWYEGSGTSDRRFLHADERGSVIAVSNASGALLAANAYDEYGIPNAGNLGRFGYTGQAWLDEIGLAYYKARMYSPTLGRFMQTDPIGYADGLNWYAYVGGDPVNGVDPTGLATVCVQPTGTRIKKCVKVDGDGDGLVDEDDLTPKEIRALQASFGGFDAHWLVIRQFYAGGQLSRTVRKFQGQLPN